MEFLLSSWWTSSDFDTDAKTTLTLGYNGTNSCCPPNLCFQEEGITLNYVPYFEGHQPSYVSDRVERLFEIRAVFWGPPLWFRHLG